METLTRNEYKVLDLIQDDLEIRESKFGITTTAEIVETLKSEGYTKEQIGGYMTSLIKKDYAFPAEDAGEWWVFDLKQRGGEVA